jgi:hypothetical protein
MRVTQTSQSLWVVIVVLVVSAWVIGLLAQAATPLSGTWRVNVAKSKYSPADRAPQNQTSRLEVAQDGIKVVTDGSDSKGRKTHTDYTAKFGGPIVSTNATVDGKPNPDQDGAAWKKVDDYTYEITNALKGKALTTTRIVVARDGKSRTTTVTGKDAHGRVVNDVVIFDRQ